MVNQVEKAANDFFQLLLKLIWKVVSKDFEELTDVLGFFYYVNIL